MAESLTPQEHIEKAEAALAAARKAREELDKLEEREPQGALEIRHKARVSASYLDLMQISHVHASIATAKLLAGVYFKALEEPDEDVVQHVPGLIGRRG